MIPEQSINEPSFDLKGYASVETCASFEKQALVDQPTLFLMCAEESGLLAADANRLADHLEQCPDQTLQEIAYGLMEGETLSFARAAIPVKDRQSAVFALRALAAHIEAHESKPAGLYLGQVDQNNPQGLLNEAVEDQAFFIKLALSGRFERLARLWVSGIAVDWSGVLNVLKVKPSAECELDRHDASPAPESSCAIQLPHPEPFPKGEGDSACSLRDFHSPQETERDEASFLSAKGSGEIWVMRPSWKLDSAPHGPISASPLILHGGPETEWAQHLAREYGGEAFKAGSLTQESLKELIENLAPERPLVFAAWREKNAPALDTSALVFAERRGVHALHGVFKAFAQKGGVGRLILVTKGLQSVMPGESIDPAFGAIVGFARSAAKELPNLSLSCVDLASETPEIEKKQREWLLRETSNEAIAYRQATRLIRRMARVQPESMPVHLPDAPACLILGGAGGLGRATSIYLAEKFSARIAWLGRRPQDAEIDSNLAEIYRLGGQAIYLQTDIAKPQEFKQALDAIHQRWGHIHLALHSAGVIRDKTIINLESDDLDAVLAPKSYGLMNLIELLADDPPEMICLHSSLDSFGLPFPELEGFQGNDAGASTFIDALALSLPQRFPGKVRVLNWGIREDERFIQPAHLTGWMPLNDPERLALFEWALACPLNQALLMKLSENASNQMQAGFCEKLRFARQTAQLDLDAGQQSLRSAFLSVSPMQLSAQTRHIHDLTQHGRERLFQIYAELGLRHQLPANFSKLVKSLDIVPERHALFKAHLDILARCGWLSISGDQQDPMIDLSGLSPAASPTFELDSAAARCLDGALQATSDVLRGCEFECNDWLESVYQDEIALFKRCLSDAAIALSRGRPLNLIEIGSADLGIIEALDRHAPGSRYVLTGLSQEGLSKVEAEYASRPNTYFKVLDIAKPPAEQDFEPGSFDLLIAANVLHASACIGDVLAHVKSLLKAEGVVLLLETSAQNDLATLISGLADGWWRLTDSEKRLPYSPFLSADGWRSALESQGFGFKGLGQIASNDALSILMMTSDGWLPEAIKPEQPALQEKTVLLKAAGLEEDRVKEAAFEPKVRVGDWSVGHRFDWKNPYPEIQTPTPVSLPAHVFQALSPHSDSEALLIEPEPQSPAQIVLPDREGNYEPIVSIKPGKGPASFWVHGATGDASWVLNFAERLDLKWPVYGLEARGIKGKEAPRKTVVTMARDYVEALRRMQPEGPYRLVGYAQGGVIVYEMAQQLLQSGETVEKMVLLDAYAPGNPMLKLMGHVYRQGFLYMLLINGIGKRWHLEKPLTAIPLEGLARKAQLKIALDHLYQHAKPDMARQPLSVYLQCMERVGQSIGKAIEAYEPKSIAAEIDTLLIRCSAGMAGPDNRYHLPDFLSETDYTEGWQDLLRNVTIEEIACDQFSLLDDPWIKQAAKAIRDFWVAADV